METFISNLKEKQRRKERKRAELQVIKLKSDMQLVKRYKTLKSAAKECKVSEQEMHKICMRVGVQHNGFIFMAF